MRHFRGTLSELPRPEPKRDAVDHRRAYQAVVVSRSDRFTVIDHYTYGQPNHREIVDRRLPFYHNRRTVVVRHPDQRRLAPKAAAAFLLAGVIFAVVVGTL